MVFKVEGGASALEGARHVGLRRVFRGKVKCLIILKEHSFITTVNLSKMETSNLSEAAVQIVLANIFRTCTDSDKFSSQTKQNNILRRFLTF